MLPDSLRNKRSTLDHDREAKTQLQRTKKTRKEKLRALLHPVLNAKRRFYLIAIGKISFGPSTGKLQTFLLIG